MTLILVCGVMAIGVYMIIDSLTLGYRDWIEIKGKAEDRK